MKSPRLVLIEWVDSWSRDSWRHLDDGLEDAAMTNRSVGWLVLDGEQVKTLAPHISGVDGPVPQQVCQTMTIPARAVVRIADLNVPEAGEP